jgi:rhodanese-related sulfurtransferase
LKNRQRRKERTELPTDINRNDVQRLVVEGAQLVEVLPPDEYNEAHLPGAINIHLKNWMHRLPNSLSRLAPSSRIVMTFSET